MFYKFAGTKHVDADSPLAAPADAKLPFNTNTVAIMETDRGVQFSVRPEELAKIALTVRPQLTLENSIIPSSRNQLVAVDNSVNQALGAIFQSDTISASIDQIPSTEATDRLAAWSDTIIKIENSGLPRAPKPPSA